MLKIFDNDLNHCLVTSRKSSSSKSRTKAVYDSNNKDLANKIKIIKTPHGRSNSKNSKDRKKKESQILTTSNKRNSSAKNDQEKRPLSPTPVYLTADIERFQKLSKQLKGAKGNSSLGFCPPDYSKLGSKPVTLEAMKREQEVKSPLWIKNNMNYTIHKISPNI